MQCKPLASGLVILLLLSGCALCIPVQNNTGEECNDNSDCESDQVCVDLKCTNPCSGMCGINTECEVQDLSPVCSCKSGYEGDPFEECKPMTVQCTENAQCPDNETCLHHRCVDPCIGACGVNSECRVVNHRHMCACLKGFVFSPRAGCKPKLIPDCQTNNHCPEDRTCRQQKCVDPCGEAICGNNTLCSVKNHYPICACKPGYTGDALHECVPTCSTVLGEEKANMKKSFLISDDTKNWMEAVSDCHSRGMYLATINTDEEMNDLRRAWNTKHAGRDANIWLGAHDLGNYRLFVWVSTGKELSFTNWATGEPTGYEYHCLKVVNTFEWYSHTCSNLYNYACEYI